MLQNPARRGSMCPMRNSFEDAVNELTAKYPQFAPEAYEFLRAGLDYTSEHLHGEVKQVHMTAEQLYLGSCAYALQEYGPLAQKLLEMWGICTSHDFGCVVYNLIEAGIFGKQKGDTQEEFDTLPDLTTLLDAPYIGALDECNDNDDDDDHE